MRTGPGRAPCLPRSREHVKRPTGGREKKRERPNNTLMCMYTRYKVPLRDVPRGVAQERSEKHTARDIVLYAYDIILRRCEISVLYYLWHSMHMSHSSRDPQAYRSQGPITKATIILIGSHSNTTRTNYRNACGVASCSAGGRQACIAL